MKKIIITNNNIEKFLISEESLIYTIENNNNLDSDYIDEEDYDSYEDYEIAVNEMDLELEELLNSYDIQASISNLFIQKVKKELLLDGYYNDIYLDGKDIVFQLSDENIENIESLIFKSNLDDFTKYYKENYGSRDGYISFMSTDMGEVWVLFKHLQAPKTFSAILNYLLSLEDNISLEYEYFDIDDKDLVKNK